MIVAAAPPSRPVHDSDKGQSARLTPLQAPPPSRPVHDSEKGQSARLTPLQPPPLPPPSRGLGQQLLYNPSHPPAPPPPLAPPFVHGAVSPHRHDALVGREVHRRRPQPQLHRLQQLPSAARLHGRALACMRVRAPAYLRLARGCVGARAKELRAGERARAREHVSV